MREARLFICLCVAFSVSPLGVLAPRRVAPLAYSFPFPWALTLRKILMSLWCDVWMYVCLFVCVSSLFVLSRFPCLFCCVLIVVSRLPCLCCRVFLVCVCLRFVCFVVFALFVLSRVMVLFVLLILFVLSRHRGRDLLVVFNFWFLLYIWLGLGSDHAELYGLIEIVCSVFIT